MSSWYSSDVLCQKMQREATKLELGNNLRRGLAFVFAVNYQPVPLISGTRCGCFSIAETEYRTGSLY